MAWSGAGVLAWITACAAVATSTGRDPTLGPEFATLALAVAWLLHIGRRARGRVDASTRLMARSRHAVVDGTAVRLLDIDQPAAFVHGVLRPHIYVSPALIRVLDAAELQGVLLHERHHRATWAPLRAMALEAWERTLAWLPPVRRALQARLAALEVEADAAAMTAGVRPETLASALIKCESAAPAAATAFASEPDARIEQLVAWGRSEQAVPPRSIPLEWAAPATVIIAVLACHLVGA